MSWLTEDLEDLRNSQIGMFFLMLAFTWITFLGSLIVNGTEPTLNFVQDNIVLLSAGFFTIAGILPFWRKNSERVYNIMRQAGFTFTMLTLSSLIVWVHSHFVTDLSPMIQLIYNFYGRLWYLTGISLIAMGLGINSISRET